MLLTAERPSGDEFRIAQEPMEPSGLVVSVSGELDVSTVPEFRELLNRALDEGQPAVVVDLTETSFIDSLALATIVRAHKRLTRGRMAIVANNPYVLLVVKAGGLDSVLDLYESREQALAAVRSGEQVPAGDRD